MKGTTHLAAGLLTASILTTSIPCIAGIAFGSLLPDIDTPTSSISHKTTGVLGCMLEHRGFTHSLAFAGITAILSPYIALGVLTHIVLDMFNPSGVSVIWPIRGKCRIAKIRTGGALDYLLGALFAIALLFVVWMRYKNA